MSAIVLTLITRRDCHLCEEMAAVVAEVMAGTALRLDRVDVDSDDELRERYGEEVPILLIDGRKAFKYRASAAELRGRLRAERRRRWLRAWRGRVRSPVDSPEPRD